jgi:hypothetical protein
MDEIGVKRRSEARRAFNGETYTAINVLSGGDRMLGQRFQRPPRTGNETRTWCAGDWPGCGRCRRGRPD